MSVELVETATAEVREAVNYLIPQLSSTAPPLTKEQFERFVSQRDVYLFIFRADTPDTDPGSSPILGMLSLATFVIPTGLRGWIEDVVVDEAARGHGAGQALVEASLAKARDLGLKTVDLTSRPTREAANRLYVRCGFEARPTNIYRYTL